MRLSIALLVALVASVDNQAQVSPSSLVLDASIDDDYLAPEYDTESAVGRTFYEGDRVAFRVILQNHGSSQNAVMPRDGGVDRLFTVDVTCDGQAMPLEVGFINRGTVASMTGGQTSTLIRPLAVAAGERLEWTAVIRTKLMRSGFYVVTAKTLATDEQDRPLGGLAQFEFEYRPRTPDRLPEILRRQAYRELFTANYSGARQSAEMLLKQYPSSYAAHAILSLIAEKEGNEREASRHRARARALLVRKQDTLLLRHNSAQVVQELLTALAAKERR
jgi:hypothetical protein